MFKISDIIKYMPRGRPKKKLEEVIKTGITGTLADVVLDPTPPTHDEYGVCISCKGGKEGCLHNNLGEKGHNTVCLKCGLIVK